jgi:hypothetical protein
MQQFQNWSATFDHDRLRVSGEYTFPTTGYMVHLARKEAHENNPEVLQLEKIVTGPTGIVADHVVTVPVKFEEQTASRYREVVIFPDATRIPVRHI